MLLAPNQVVSLPHSMVMNLPVPTATPQQLILVPQKSMSQVPAKQILTTTASNQNSQGNVTSVQINATGNSAGVPFGSTKTATVTCDISTVMGNSTCSNAGSKTTKTTCAAVSSTPQLTSLVTGVFSTALRTSLTTAVSSTPLLTSTSPSTAVPMLSQQSSCNAQRNSASTLVTQLGIPSQVTPSKNIAVTAPVPNRIVNNVFNTSVVNMSAPQQVASLVNSITSAVSLGKEQLSTVSPSPSLNAPHVKATTSQSNALTNTSLPFLPIVNNEPLTTPVALSTQVTQSEISSVLSTLNDIPWSTALQTFTSSNIPSQTQTVQSSTLQSTDLLFPPTTNLDSTSALACSSFSLTDSVASTTAPLDSSLDICSMADNGTAPSLLSPRSLQTMLQCMLSQSDQQLLWNTMLNSPMMSSPIFKLADTSNSTATMTSTATESQPRISPLELGSEQFMTSQQSHLTAHGTEVSQQNNDLIPESIHDAFSDLNVQGVTEQDRLAEEVIFSSMLSSRAKGSGYGLGIDIEELLDNAGIVQDAAFNL